MTISITKSTLNRSFTFELSPLILEPVHDCFLGSPVSLLTSVFVTVGHVGVTVKPLLDDLGE